ncbi:MAG: tripartite tricarboxylate transporter substrate binding protein [Beijerinckiaceae bacterium]|nr:tripartite tricarboxylate transporter substrate binding protein [Beijerinckiaceae bacterium]
MHFTRRSITAGLALTPLLAAGGAKAQGAGNVITLVVPFPAGGSVDAVTRLVQPGLAERQKATMVVENKGGASGSIGAAQVAKSPPDGKTWLFVFDSHAVNPSLQKLTFDSEKDLAPVMLIGTAPNVLATHPSRPFRTLADVVKAAKENPGKVTYATIGAGSLGHLTMVRLGKQLGIELTHVPYRGGGPALNDAISGHVDLIIGSAALINPQLEGKKLVPVVQFGPKRATSPQLAAVPTSAESGAPGIESLAWWGVFAPAGTPADIIAKFEADLRATLKDERVANTLASSQQIEVLAGGPEVLRAFFAKEMKVWGDIVRENKIEISSQ